MGTWGTKIFEDDTSADVRLDFIRLLRAGTSPNMATHLVLGEWSRLLDDSYAAPPIWLGLAATQLKLRCLHPWVRARALHVIESGADLRRWKEHTDKADRRRVVRAFRNRILSTPVGPV
jgi:hypothetical protein